MDFLKNILFKLIITLAILMIIVAIIATLFVLAQKASNASFFVLRQQFETIFPAIAISSLAGNLIFAGISSFVLFILTRIILGRGVKISGDFWEHQQLAKSKILWLNILFFAMLGLIFIVSFNLFKLIFYFFEIELSLFGGYTELPMLLSGLLIGVIIIAYFIKSLLMAKNSIDSLAKTLQAREITNSSQVLHHQEKTLLNVIEEMAIASNMPMPRVFVMDNEYNINAMCSGERFGKYDEKIAIFVTKGALDTFNRDELQGVIGHEFSHAFHGDVALNLKIFSLVFALTCVMMIGEVILKGASKVNARGNSKDSKSAVSAIVAIAMVFYALGFLGSLCASMIQAAISRQKEFLADSSSVQYTRNPNGIKSALVTLLNIQNGNTSRLKNITSQSAKSAVDSISKLNLNSLGKITNPKAKPCAHMFFLSGFNSIFATHPPLEKRIERLNKMG